MGQLCGYQIIIQCRPSRRFARISAKWLWPVSLSSILEEADQGHKAHLHTKCASQIQVSIISLSRIKRLACVIKIHFYSL
jgi:hypothetical protein